MFWYENGLTQLLQSFNVDSQVKSAATFACISFEGNRFPVDRITRRRRPRQKVIRRIPFFAERIMAVEPTRALSVLVVDDDSDTADSCRDLLALFGFSVRSAYRGSDALRSARDDPPDIVLVDIMMPGMNGWELARQLTQTAIPPVIVAITGCGAEEDRQRSKLAGIDYHLIKPVATANLIEVLNRFARTTVHHVELSNQEETPPSLVQPVRSQIEDTADSHRLI